MNLRGMSFALLSGFAFVGAFLLLVWLLGGCTVVQPLPPVAIDADGGYPGASDIVVVFPDDSAQAASSPCGLACAQLAKIGCPEGGKTPSGSSCYHGCAHQAQLEKIPVACWAKASSRPAARACGPELRCAEP